jgi:hypothetical protein
MPESDDDNDDDVASDSPAKGQGAESLKQGAESLEQGAESLEQGAESLERPITHGRAYSSVLVVSGFTRHISVVDCSRCFALDVCLRVR